MKLLLMVTIFSYLKSSAYADDENGVWNKNHKLREDLLKNYDKQALPQKNVNGTTDLYVLLRPRAIWINDEDETLTVDSWMALYWVDERLKWNKEDYGKLRKVQFGDDELWKPDLTVYNNAAITDIDHYGNTHFLVYSNGGVIWVPPATMVSLCPLNLLRWPFDEHTCSIQIGSWTSHGDQINLLLWHNRTTMSLYTYMNMSSSWEVLKATQRRNVVKYECCKEPYIDIFFDFTLKRRVPSFTSCIVIPAVMLPFLLLSQFILPVDHPKRITIGCCCAILVLAEIIFLKFTIPKLGTAVPLIVKYYSQCLILVILSLGLTAILSRLCHPQDPIVSYPPPELLKRILKGPVATILCLGSHASKVGLSGGFEEDGEVLATDHRKVSYAHEWLFVAKAMDRLVIILLAIIFIFSFIGFLGPK